MKIQLMSDLHLEFHRDRGVAFAQCLDPTDVDVLVIAGDFSDLAGIPFIMRILLSKYPEVVYVAGNHEFYGVHAIEDVWRIRDGLSGYTNLHWLENSTATIQGQRFVGATMWFKDTPTNVYYQRDWSDFQQIPGLAGWVYGRHEETINFFENTVKPSDVVVTHYVPTLRAVPERFKTSQYNCFFIVDLDNFILDTQPKLWAFGHTHDSNDFMIGTTRVTNNPFGYVGFELNPNFDARKIIEI